MTVSIFDRAALRYAFARCDAIVNLASAIIPSTSRFVQPRAWVDNDRVRTEGSAAIGESCSIARARRNSSNSWCSNALA